MSKATMDKAYIVSTPDQGNGDVYFAGYEVEDRGGFERTKVKWTNKSIEAFFFDDAIDAAQKIKELKKSISDQAVFSLIEIRITLCPIKIVVDYIPQSRG